jgi:hypothetical protein
MAAPGESSYPTLPLSTQQQQPQQVQALPSLFDANKREDNRRATKTIRLPINVVHTPEERKSDQVSLLLSMPIANFAPKDPLVSIQCPFPDELHGLVEDRVWQESLRMVNDFLATRGNAVGLKWHKEYPQEQLRELRVGDKSVNVQEKLKKPVTKSAAKTGGILAGGVLGAMIAPVLAVPTAVYAGYKYSKMKDIDDEFSTFVQDLKWHLRVISLQPEYAAHNLVWRFDKPEKTKHFFKGEGDSPFHLDFVG